MRPESGVGPASNSGHGCPDETLCHSCRGWSGVVQRSENATWDVVSEDRPAQLPTGE
jgi:hypothetical protein